MAFCQPRTLLAMSIPLRFVHSSQPISRPIWLHTQRFHIIARCSYSSKHRPMKRALTVGAFTVPHSPQLPITPVPITTLLESPLNEPEKPLLLSDDLSELFTSNPATFYHGTSDFYTLKKNTRVPEICILGRSNVGKSTFVNALAGRRGDSELAHTSAKAGRTRAMNAFGFGPAPPMKDLADTDQNTKRTEDLPKHKFFVVDMPGYGFKSLQDWGRHISLYLNKRHSVKGAVLLIDGEVGPKAGDYAALEILREAGLKTAVVLTKADKAKDEEMLKDTCRKMWEAMREAQGKDLNQAWSWERDFFVTALGATKKEVGIDSVHIARLAVARLAGLVVEKERPQAEEAKGWSGKVVSFDEIVFTAKGSSEATTPVGPASSAPSPCSSFTALERAAMEHFRVQTATKRPSDKSDAWSSPQTNPRHTQTRAFSTTRLRRQPLSPAELEVALAEFTASLKVNPTPLDRARHAKKQSLESRSSSANKTPYVWDPTRVKPKRVSKKSKLEKKASDLQVYRNRVRHEELQAERHILKAHSRELGVQNDGRWRSTLREELKNGHPRGSLEPEPGWNQENDHEGTRPDGWPPLPAEVAQELHESQLRRSKRGDSRVKKEKVQEAKKEPAEDDAFAAKFKTP